MSLMKKKSIITSPFGRSSSSAKSKLPEATELLEKSEQFFRAIFEQASVGVAVVNSDSAEILQINQRFADLVGRSIDELLGTQIFELTHPDDLEDDQTMRQQILDGKNRIIARQKRYLKKNGNTVWVNVSISAIGDESHRENEPMHITVVQDITEQKKAEKTLKESESTARALLEAPTDSIFLTDEYGIIHDVNKTAAEKLGQPIHELIGRCAYDYMPPDVAAERAALTEKVFKTGEIQRFEDKRGDIWFDSVIYPITDDTGAISKAAVIARDITHRKTVERALAKSAGTFRTIFEQASVGVAVVVSESGQFLQVNQRYADILGYTIDEMLNKTVTDITFPEDLPKDDTARINLVENRDAELAWQKRYFKKDGSLVWVSVSVSATWDYEDQRDERVHITVVQDITEQKHAEEDTKESNERYNSLFERSNDVVFLHDFDGNFLDANPAALELLGYTRKELLKLVFVDIMYPEEVTAGRKAMREVIKTGSLKKPFQYRLKPKKGDNIWVESTASLLYKEGTAYAVQEVSRDITQRKKYEDELLHAKHLADQANQSKSEFLANISHELRTPMQGVLGFSKLGLDRIESINKQKTGHYFTEIYTSGRRLLNMVNNLLDLSRLEAGMEVYRFRRRNLSNVVVDVLEELQPLINEKNLEMVFQEPGKAGLASFDRDKIMQVVRNLLANAIKYSKVKSSIHMVITKRDDCVAMSIEDRGPGIPKEELVTIFDKFVQSSQTKTGAGGTGLGLAICYEIVKAHNGKIWAENNKKGGATFHFMLPVSQTTYRPA